MFELIREIIAREIEVEESEITMESNISEDLGLDSMDVYNLIEALEEAGISVPADAELKTIGDIVKTLENKNKES